MTSNEIDIPKESTVANLKSLVRQLECALEFPNPVEKEISRLEADIATLREEHRIEEKIFRELVLEVRHFTEEKRQLKQRINDDQDEVFRAKRMMEEARIQYIKAHAHYEQEKALLIATIRDLEHTKEQKDDEKETIEEITREIIAGSSMLQRLNREMVEEEHKEKAKQIDKLVEVNKEVSRVLDREQLDLLHRKHIMAKEMLEDFIKSNQKRD